MSRYDRLTMFRAAALQGLTAHEGSSVWVGDACRIADEMMAECDKRDREEKRENA